VPKSIYYNFLSPLSLGKPIDPIAFDGHSLKKYKVTINVIFETNYGGEVVVDARQEKSWSRFARFAIFVLLHRNLTQVKLCFHNQ
jgi:helix-turn-helix protein